MKRYGEKLGGLLWNRFTVHYTPTHGSWLNQAEIEVSLLSRQCPGQRRIAICLHRAAKFMPGCAASTATAPHRLEVHAQTGPPETALLNHTDTQQGSCRYKLLPAQMQDRAASLCEGYEILCLRIHRE